MFFTISISLRTQYLCTSWAASALVAKCSDLIGQIGLFTCEKSEKTNSINSFCKITRWVWMASITGESKNIFNVQNIPRILRVQCLEAIIHSILRPDEDSLSKLSYCVCTWHCALYLNSHLHIKWIMMRESNITVWICRFKQAWVQSPILSIGDL